MANLGNCRSCNAQIIWATTSTGKSMPLDPEPLQYGGNIRMDDDGKCWVLHKDEPRFPGEKLYRSHFATCSASKAHRKPKK